MFGRKFGNVMFLSFMRENKLYNDYLNSGDIIIGMSGGEGWGLPEFQSLCMGKHAVILDCSSYKDWANEKNSVMVKPSGKSEVYDNIFFKKGAEFNQGSIFTFNEDEFIAGCEEAIKRGMEPIRMFMLQHTRDADLGLFLSLSQAKQPETVDQLSTFTIIPAFMLSELKTAFQMGAMLFLPFLIVDLIVASVLMSMGMMMLPPVTISLPFKLLLFVLMDGWSLLVTSMVEGIR